YRAYASETLMRYPSIAYLVNESMHVNMLDFAWLPGAPTTPEGYGGSIPLMVKERNPASFVVDLPGLIGLNTSYFISFIPPDGSTDGWTYSAGMPVQSVNDTPACSLLVSVRSGFYSLSVKYAPYYTSLPFYAVSLTAAALSTMYLLYYATVERRKKN
ncbi:MAG: hypothetical protein QXP70_00565, partial [Methanomassiliicoccales archaeon]